MLVSGLAASPTSLVSKGQSGSGNIRPLWSRSNGPHVSDAFVPGVNLAQVSV
jgi:hypothetical protein